MLLSIDAEHATLSNRPGISGLVFDGFIEKKFDAVSKAGDIREGVCNRSVEEFQKNYVTLGQLGIWSGHMPFVISKTLFYLGITPITKSRKRPKIYARKDIEQKATELSERGINIPKWRKRRRSSKLADKHD